MSQLDVAGGHGALVGVANASVHVVLYSHYLISIINPEYGRNGWYKKYITQMQMVRAQRATAHTVHQGVAGPRITLT